MGRGAALLLLAALGAGGVACGRYGSPERDPIYQKQDQEAARARAERRKATSPQERNDPLPPAP
jgi:hypothetical protein